MKNMFRFIGQFVRQMINGNSRRHRVTFGYGCKIHSTTRFDVSKGGSITLGQGCQIEQGCILDAYGGHIEIGDRVYLGPYCVLYGHGGLKIGEDTLIATHTVIIPANHGITGTNLIAAQALSTTGIDIGRGCWLGCGVKVLDGVTIGDGSVLGAGSVVTRHISKFSVAVGVPARVIRSRTLNPNSSSTDGEAG